MLPLLRVGVTEFMVQESLGRAGDSRRVGCSTHEGGELWHSDGDVYALGAGRTGWYECDWRRVGRAVVVNSNVVRARHLNLALVDHVVEVEAILHNPRGVERSSASW